MQFPEFIRIFETNKNSLLADRKRYVGATSHEEQVFLFCWANQFFKDKGIIVELGPWLGSLTIPLVDGLSLNKSISPDGRKLYSYDRFMWESIMDEWTSGTPHEGCCNEGESFKPYYLELTNNSDFLKAHSCNLEHVRYDGPEIELLIDDGVKSYDSGRNVYNEFLPHLLEGGYLIHQDFLFAGHFFVACLLFSVRDQFAYRYSVPNAPMVVFQCIQQVKENSITPDQATFDLQTTINTIGWLIEILPPEDHDLAHLSYIVHLAQNGYMDRAKQHTDETRLISKMPENPTLAFQIEIMKGWGLQALFNA
jgi:hypothetical protein